MSGNNKMNSEVGFIIQRVRVYKCFLYTCNYAQPLQRKSAKKNSENVTKLGIEETLEGRVIMEIRTTVPKYAEIPVASVEEKESKIEICVG